MSGKFAAAAAGARTIGLQTPECGIAELWRCWIVTRRVAKLPECEAVAKRVERPAPGAVSSGRDADAPSRLPLPGHKCSPSFFPGGGDTLRAVPGRIRALHNPFWPDSRSSQRSPGRIRALHNPLPGLIHTPPEPFPPPGAPAARLRNSAPPERQSRRACDSAGESPGQRCKGGVTQGIPTGEARSRRGIGPYGTVSAGAGPTARQPAKTGRRTRRTTPTRGLPTGTEETTRQRRSGSRPLCRQLVDKMSKDVETRR